MSSDEILFFILLLGGSSASESEFEFRGALDVPKTCRVEFLKVGLVMVDEDEVITDDVEF